MWWGSGCRCGGGSGCGRAGSSQACPGPIDAIFLPCPQWSSPGCLCPALLSLGTQSDGAGPLGTPLHLITSVGCCFHTRSHPALLGSGLPRVGFGGHSSAHERPKDGEEPATRGPGDTGPLSVLQDADAAASRGFIMARRCRGAGSRPLGRWGALRGAFHILWTSLPGSPLFIVRVDGGHSPQSHAAFTGRKRSRRRLAPLLVSETHTGPIACSHSGDSTSLPGERATEPSGYTLHSPPDRYIRQEQPAGRKINQTGPRGFAGASWFWAHSARGSEDVAGPRGSPFSLHTFLCPGLQRWGGVSSPGPAGKPPGSPRLTGDALRLGQSLWPEETAWLTLGSHHSRVRKAPRQNHRPEPGAGPTEDGGARGSADSQAATPGLPPRIFPLRSWREEGALLC